MPTATPKPRLRARTATVSFGNMPSAAAAAAAGGSSSSGGLLVASPVDEVGDLAPAGSTANTGSLGRGTTRRSSKSVSGTRPPLSTSASSHRTLGSPALCAVDVTSSPVAGPSSISNSTTSAGSPTPSAQSSLASTRGVRQGLKRRISTPNLAKRTLAEEDELDPAPSLTPQKAPVYETRARSTSTSIVVPQTLQATPEPSTSAVLHHPLASSSTSPLPPPPPGASSSSTPPWSGMYITPPSPPSTSSPATLDYGGYQPEGIHPGASSGSAGGFFASAYGIGEAAVSRFMAWGSSGSRRQQQRPRRSSDVDSEKGLNEDQVDLGTSEDFDEKRAGRWGVASGADAQHRESVSYFALPPTPPEDCPADFAYPLSLPTPTLSTQSLSHPPGGSSTRRQRRASRAAALAAATPADGWWVKVYRSVSGSPGTNGKTAQVLRELGWTVALLAGLFVVSFVLVLYSISSMPITKLKTMPKSTTDLQLLSAEMRTYMASGSAGWWHTVGVLTYIGCWKHAWSVPGAVVLNILVGSVFEPLNALALLTVITACGSLGAYSLSRPLAPLIAVLFPKPLALVRAALAPDAHTHASISLDGAHRPSIHLETPLRLDTLPTEPRPTVWRRLLLMRAMGFVPWSGMNVACGVVGVDWRTFWLTTAAGSASWSYVTASVGNILSRLALPSATADEPGESLTSLLRDPGLIFKLVFLTLLTLIPVLLKRRTSTPEEEDDDSSLSSEPASPTMPNALALDTAGTAAAAYPPEPSSPLAISLASFTPTPHVFDLLSFGRTAVRQGVRVVVGGARQAAASAQRLVRSA